MEIGNLINVETMTREWWDELYAVCREIIARPGEFADACRGRVMASLFYEPSTRTNFSFQAAMMRLGGNVFGFADPTATSHAKGESFADTIRMCSSYSDTIVIRSPHEGAALAASLFSCVPVINAGDGGHAHPTQTLADLTTICQRRGGLENLNIGLCGDLKNGRTVHSLITALSRFPGIKLFLISPRELALPEYMMDFMRGQSLKYIEVTGLEATMPQLDVLYMTRIQKERFTDPLEYERNKGVYILNRRKLERAKADLLIMHPLPRVDEINIDVDSDPRAAYFEQARYGMFIRMALLLHTTKSSGSPPSFADDGASAVCKNPRCITQTEKYLPALTRYMGTSRLCAYCDKSIVS